MKDSRFEGRKHWGKTGLDEDEIEQYDNEYFEDEAETDGRTTKRQGKRNHNRGYSGPEKRGKKKFKGFERRDKYNFDWNE